MELDLSGHNREVIKFVRDYLEPIGYQETFRDGKEIHWISQGVRVCLSLNGEDYYLYRSKFTPRECKLTSIGMRSCKYDPMKIQEDLPILMKEFQDIDINMSKLQKSGGYDVGDAFGKSSFQIHDALANAISGGARAVVIDTSSNAVDHTTPLAEKVQKYLEESGNKDVIVFDSLSELEDNMKRVKEIEVRACPIPTQMYFDDTVGRSGHKRQTINFNNSKNKRKRK